MPINRRQVDLGMDEEDESWMRHVYELLAAHRDLAYSSGELCQAILGVSCPDDTTVKFSHALDALVWIGAVEKGKVADTDYYAFLREFDTRSWEAMPEVLV